MIIIGIILYFSINNGVKYLGGDSTEYTKTNPGKLLVDCLDGESSNICLLANNYENEFNNSEININKNDNYVFGSSNISIKYKFTMKKDFKFIISKKYTIEDLEVFILMFILLFIDR
jgi:hypothetical protein